MNRLTHINEDGSAEMVDISDKPVSQRLAVAVGTVHMKQGTLSQLIELGSPKGDVIGVARIAGIQAAKSCHQLIPLCHQLPLSKVSIEFEVDEEIGLRIIARCSLKAQTGVEMEAMTAVSVAALTVYDMCKAVDRSMRITDIKLLSKEGGRTGAWKRDDS